MLNNHAMSDREIAEYLDAQGWKLARRTVAKYREQLNIPISHQRRKALNISL
jgi:RNA polymerase sigma-54 factor